ncbi:MAG: glutathione S-transferase family protein [Proteobacteria bacterium]|nr:glutathione S-transferase family protein [Pseudomonadota bacterium]
MITVTAFRWVPPMVQGLVRDLRVRWALEEAGLPYKEHLIGMEEKTAPSYRLLQPFAQVPAYREDDLVLFESDAIVLHIAERSEALLPREPKARARAIAWIFAAINSIEPSVQNLGALDLFYASEEWAKLRRPGQVEQTAARLTQLSDRLQDRLYLEDRFTAGDLLMTTVLRNLRSNDLLSKLPVLEAYRKRCEARPAFQKALADHMAVFAKHVPVAA